MRVLFLLCSLLLASPILAEPDKPLTLLQGGQGKPTTPTQTPPISVEAPGTGTWICSPAGAGQPSRCHRR